ncbi:MAG: CRTAC1 family protein, partial [Planctomycetes bacterium]|nr:CRTAC1 family protein [Planctomycetota bacterium]
DQSLGSLFRNRRNGKFEDVALEVGVFDPRGAMGVAAFDFQADGDQDFLITHGVSEDPAFYVNELSAKLLVFDDQATRVGLRKPDGALVGWGTGFVDFDNDGDQDLYLIYGSTIEDELTLDVLTRPKMIPQKSAIYESRGGKWRSLQAGAGSYFAETHVGRGAAVSDFDLDGRPDIAINNHGGEPALLRNTSKSTGNWIELRLVGRDCNRDAANARATVYCDGLPPQMREVFVGSSYLSCDSKTLHFGLGKADAIRRIEIRWPCGGKQSLESVKLNRVLTVTETTRDRSK